MSREKPVHTRPGDCTIPKRDCPECPMSEYKLNTLEQQVSDDVDWAETAPEVQKHQGQLVVVHKRRVIAVGTDRSALLAEAAAREHCHRDELAVVVVPRAEL